MQTGFQSLFYLVRVQGELTQCVLLSPIYFRSWTGVLYEAPVGTPTDFASIPAVFWGFPLFLIPTGWWAQAAVVHDAAFKNLLYRFLPDGTRVKAFPLDNPETEQAANELLLEMMESLRPTPTIFQRLQYWAIFIGVTLGGWHGFVHDREDV